MTRKVIKMLMRIDMYNLALEILALKSPK
jgi:hypothetical protein